MAARRSALTTNGSAMSDTGLTPGQVGYLDQLCAENRDAIGEWIDQMLAYRDEAGEYAAMQWMWGEAREFDRAGLEALAVFSLHLLAGLREEGALR